LPQRLVLLDPLPLPVLLLEFLCHPGRFVVRSAGTISQEGLRASLSAVEVMKERGIDISTHQSRSVDDDLMEWADVVLTMTSDHLGELHERFPESTDKIYLFSSFPNADLEGAADIPDPMGSGIATYREVGERIEREVDRMVSHLLTRVR